MQLTHLMCWFMLPNVFPKVKVIITSLYFLPWSRRQKYQDKGLQKTTMKNFLPITRKAWDTRLHKKVNHIANWYYFCYVNSRNRNEPPRFRLAAHETYMVKSIWTLFLDTSVTRHVIVIFKLAYFQWKQMFRST